MGEKQTARIWHVRTLMLRVQHQTQGCGNELVLVHCAVDLRRPNIALSKHMTAYLLVAVTVAFSTVPAGTTRNTTFPSVSARSLERSSAAGLPFVLHVDWTCLPSACQALQFT